jgi:putative phosphoesterase
MRRTIGLISDTHGLLRPDVHDALAGVELILHAGDVGGEEILEELALIAPVRAVAGNCDDPSAPTLAREIDIELEGVSIHVSHGHELGVPRPASLVRAYSAAQVIVYGHTHKPLIARHGAQLVVNPGAAGPRRFNLLPSVARLTIASTGADVQLVELKA